MTVSRSLRLRLFPVTETVTRTGLIATAAAAVKRAIPASGAISKANGLARVAPARSATEKFRHYFEEKSCVQISCQFWSLFTFIIHFSRKKISLMSDDMMVVTVGRNNKTDL